LGGVGYYGDFTIIQVIHLKFLEQHLQHPQEKIKIKIKIKLKNETIGQTDHFMLQ
jgi:hypothetical protein